MTDTTQQVIERQRSSGVHAQAASPKGWVSTESKWADNIWTLDGRSLRMRVSDTRLDWSSYPPHLVEQFKALVWSLLVARLGAKPIAISAIKAVEYRMRYLAAWMERRRLRSFRSISPTQVQVFIQDLKAHLREKGKKREADYDVNTVFYFLNCLQNAHDQRAALAQAGHEGVELPPFGLGSPWSAAEAIIPDVEGFTPPLPDEIAIPIVQAAHRFLGRPADDIIEMHRHLRAARGRKAGLGSLAIQRATQRALMRFEFGTVGGEDSPWHVPVADYVEVAIRQQEQRRLARELAKAVEGGGAGCGDKDPNPSDEDAPQGSIGEDEEDDSVVSCDEIEEPQHLYSAVDLLRRFTSNLVGACATVIRFHSGIRHGEIFDLEPGLRRDGLPRCVSVGQSLSGAYDLFFLEGKVSKGLDDPEDARWLLASRPAGSTNTPIAVLAIQVLCRLFEPWRKWSTVPESKNVLLLQLGLTGIPHNPKLVTPLASEQLAMHMKQFIVDRVDLSHLDPTDERLSSYCDQPKGRGWNVQSRQWRKTWANFVIRVDTRLLPAISQQFQHLSTTLTEEAYIGKDAMQLGIVESAAVERAVKYMRRVLEGEPDAGLGMRKVLNEELKELRAELRGLTGNEREHRLRTWLVERGAKIWPAPHGLCFVSLLPGESRCHALGGTSDFTNVTPNWQTRCPRLCSGCPCFAVDEEQIPFWAKRYLDNKATWEAAVARRLEVNYVVARERWVQSENILKALDVDLTKLEEFRDAA